MNGLDAVVLRAPNGQNWMLRVLDDEYGPRMMTSKTDIPGENMLKIKSFEGFYHKIKVSNEGQIITYPLDSLR